MTNSSRHEIALIRVTRTLGAKSAFASCATLFLVSNREISIRVDIFLEPETLAVGRLSKVLSWRVDAALSLENEGTIRISSDRKSIPISRDVEDVSGANAYSVSGTRRASRERQTKVVIVALALLIVKEVFIKNKGGMGW